VDQFPFFASHPSCPPTFTLFSTACDTLRSTSDAAPPPDRNELFLKRCCLSFGLRSLGDVCLANEKPSSGKAPIRGLAPLTEVGSAIHFSLVFFSSHQSSKIRPPRAGPQRSPLLFWQL